MAERLLITLPRLVTYKRLTDIHDELTEQMNRALGIHSALSIDVPENFPPPPYPGSSTIIMPITTLTELVREGREMHHCVSMYAKEVAQGSFYVYRVTFPVRATAAISRYGREWTLREVERACNKPVTDSERKFIEDGIFR